MCDPVLLDQPELMSKRERKKGLSGQEKSFQIVYQCLSNIRHSGVGQEQSVLSNSYFTDVLPA